MIAHIIERLRSQEHKTAIIEPSPIPVGITGLG